MDFKVSVAVCTFNGSEFIKEQLLSIINQTRKPDEIVVCDDISSDETIEVVRTVLESTNISYSVVVNESRLGVTKNFEKAISMCNGDIVFTSDQDDCWVENKIERILEEFSKKSTVNLVFSNAELVDSDFNKLPGDLWTTTNFSASELQKDKHEVLALLLNHNFVTGATMAFRRKVIHRITPIPNSWMHDYWIAIQCLIEGEIIGIPEKLIYYKQHSNNVVGARKLSLSNKTKKYIQNFKNLNGIRTQKVTSLNDLVKHLQQNETDSNIFKEVKNCYIFWKESTQLGNVSKVNGIKWTIKNLNNQNYYKYYTGFRGGIRDILVLLIKSN